MSNPIKILVIGAGIAGPAICYWLKRFGFSPVLIEKAASIRKGGQALDVRGIATHIAKDIAQERSDKILAMIKSVSNAITLPQYE